jgi:hypothetical protein
LGVDIIICFGFAAAVFLIDTAETFQSAAPIDQIYSFLFSLPGNTEATSTSSSELFKLFIAFLLR